MYSQIPLFITLFIVYSQISNIYFMQIVNILLYAEADAVWMCR